MAQFLLGTPDTEAFFRFGQLSTTSSTTVSGQEDNEDNRRPLSVASAATPDFSPSSNHRPHRATISHSHSSLSSIANAFRHRSKKPPLTPNRPPLPPSSSSPQPPAPSSRSPSRQSSFFTLAANQQTAHPAADIPSPASSLSFPQVDPRPLLPPGPQQSPSPPVVMSATRAAQPEAKEHASLCLSSAHGDGSSIHDDGGVRDAFACSGAGAGAGEEKRGRKGKGEGGREDDGREGDKRMGLYEKVHRAVRWTEEGEGGGRDGWMDTEEQARPSQQQAVAQEHSPMHAHGEREREREGRGQMELQLRRVDERLVEGGKLMSAMTWLCGFQAAVVQRRQHVFVMAIADVEDRNDGVCGARAPASYPNTDQAVSSLGTATTTTTTGSNGGRSPVSVPPSLDLPLSLRGRQRACEVGACLSEGRWGVTRIVCPPHCSAAQTAALLAAQLASTGAAAGGGRGRESGMGHAMGRPVSALTLPRWWPSWPAGATGSGSGTVSIAGRDRGRGHISGEGGYRLVRDSPPTAAEGAELPHADSTATVTSNIPNTLAIAGTHPHNSTSTSTSTGSTPSMSMSTSIGSSSASQSVRKRKRGSGVAAAMNALWLGGEVKGREKERERERGYRVVGLSSEGSRGEDDDDEDEGEGEGEGEEGEAVQCCFSPRLCAVIGCCKVHGGQRAGGSLREARKARRQVGSEDGAHEQHGRARSRRGSAHGVTSEGGGMGVGVGEGVDSSVEDMFLSTSFDWMHCDERATVPDMAARGGTATEDREERMRSTVWRIADECLDDNLIFVVHCHVLMSCLMECHRKRSTPHVWPGAVAHFERAVFRDREDMEDCGVGPWHLDVSLKDSLVVYD